MSQRSDAIAAARGFFMNHPAELARILRSAAGLRFGLPLDALRWLASRAEQSGAVSDIQITPVPPGISVSATVDAMKTKVRASADLYIQRVKINQHELRIELRLDRVKLALAEDSTSPVALLIKSGVLDLGKPGNVVKQLPGIPPFVVDAHDDRIILDLMKHPKIARDEHLRARIELATAFLTVHGVETDESHLDVSLRAAPEGIFHALRTVRRVVVDPGVLKAREQIKLLRDSF